MTFTIATVNVNGIRAATKVRNENNHGMVPWLENTPADIVLMQEVRANEEQTQEALRPALDAGWQLVQAPAAAKGRAGVAILSKLPLRDVHIGFGHGLDNHPGDRELVDAREFDDAGRYIEATVTVPADDGPKDLVVASLYLPSGNAGSEKQDEKYRFLDVFGQFLSARAEAANSGAAPDMLIGGDWNICHRRQDLKNWRTNRTKSGFLPDERAFMEHILGTSPDAESQIGDNTDAGRNGNPAGQVGEFFGAVNYTASEFARQRIEKGAPEAPGWTDVMRSLRPDEDGPYSWWTFRGQAFDNDAGWRLDLQTATHGLRDRAQKAWVDKAAAYDQRWSDHSPVIVEYR